MSRAFPNLTLDSTGLTASLAAAYCVMVERMVDNYAVKVPVGSPADLSYLLYHGHLVVRHHANVSCPLGASDVKLPEPDNSDPMV